jgi:hypothetical protein
MGYQLIETIEVGSGGAASIEFTSIPQDGVQFLTTLRQVQNQHRLKMSAKTMALWLIKMWWLEVGQEPQQ